MVNVVNRSRGRQTLNGKDGTRVTFAPGEGRDIDDEFVIERAKKIKTFEIEGFSRSKTLEQRTAELGSTREPEATDDGPLRQQLEDLEQNFANQSEELNVANTNLASKNTRIEELEGQLQSQGQELEGLRSENAGFLGKLQAVMTSASSPYAGRSLQGLNAKHKGRGSYAVVNDADEDVVESLTKDQSDEFNALSDIDKLVWVDAQWTPPKQAEDE